VIGGWALLRRDDHITQPKKVRVIFQFINFGDGTGFWGTTAAPLPHPKQAASNTGPGAPDLKKHDPKRAIADWRLIALNSPPQSPWFSALPAFLPAKFLSTESSSPITISAGLEPDICCPGTSCTWAKQTLTRCYCSDINNPDINDIPDVEFPACTDSTGACSTIDWTTQWCDFPNIDGTTFKLSCQYASVTPCGGGNAYAEPIAEPIAHAGVIANSDTLSCRVI
jgi:hypothetical protein